MLKEVLKAKNSKRKQKTGKSEKKIKEQTIQSLFERQSDKEPASKSSSDSNLKTFPDHVYTSGLTFKGLSKCFYFNNGRNIGKNAKRNDNRNENPLLEEDGKTVGLKRLTRGNRDSKKDLISKVLDFIKNNGPVIKTQHVCSYYQTLIKSNARAMSSEFIEKLGKYSEIKQIYVNGTGYIITGENQHVSPLIKQLEEMSRSKDQENVKHLIKNRIKNTYTGAIKSLKDPHDKQILKGLMANITTAEFMTQLEGKKNKSGYMNSRDTLDLRVKEYQNIEQTCLSVRNDMTNQQQAAFYKRMITRRKTKELKTVFEGRGRMLKCEQYPDLAAVLEFCFSEYNPRNANGGLESHPRLTDGILYRSCDNSKTMKQAREIIMAVAPEGFQISLSSCYNYTENYRSNSHQAIQHHAGKNINAKIALNAPQRTGVPQLVVNLHWSSANANIILDMAYERQDSTFVDSKDAKAIVCANVAPVQKPGRTWKKRVYLDHDWDQSKTFAITPMTHLILQTEKQVQITSGGTVIRTKRTGRGISILNLSYFEPETAFKTLNEIFIMMIHPETSHFFRNPDSGEFKKDFVFVVDNGPSTAPNNLIVKMCLLRLFHFLKLRSLCQVSYAEYNSKRNPVERVHAEENKALSRHGPFKVETKFIKVGSNDHKIVMENMLHEVSSCLRSGTFNNESLITVRGTQ
ncbi:uncharacterized protein LOC132747483 [Ruditapes philippinarum]|uniref:uncharacterized protein LOC132747483 n=1 Tax=Ruditapes philippinarum TaxID=129788 RepID=UPI00295A6C28|nr:uncharacterized protein LOC132747483 [Ruditapes philippinarum]